MATIILDAGHGGNDPGDAYGNRFEKNDSLKLALAVGNELERYGYQVEYTRITDIYLSQIDRVEIANRIGGDLLLSLHRIIGIQPVSERGLEFYVNELGGVSEEAAINIAEALHPLGFCFYSIQVRSELPILSSVNIPSLMMGIGYMNSEADNILLDNRLNDIAAAIALGIYNTIPVNNRANINMLDNGSFYGNGDSSVLYGVQVGLFQDRNNANALRDELLLKGYVVQLVYKDSFYAVIVGAFDNLDSAAQTELDLRLEGYDTLIVEL